MNFKPGDRVQVHDEGLDAIQAIAGRDPNFSSSFRNDCGTVDEVRDGLVYINFDSEDGPGQGACAPYPISDVRLLPAISSAPDGHIDTDVAPNGSHQEPA